MTSDTSLVYAAAKNLDLPIINLASSSIATNIILGIMNGHTQDFLYNCENDILILSKDTADKLETTRTPLPQIRITVSTKFVHLFGTLSSVHIDSSQFSSNEFLHFLKSGDKIETSTASDYHNNSGQCEKSIDVRKRCRWICSNVELLIIVSFFTRFSYIPDSNDNLNVRLPDWVNLGTLAYMKMQPLSWKQEPLVDHV
ncbi:hypothetical protein GJ496_001358 [Pomphorhynchus laevis]|nr:hypothetical protein GJ496_001358 [Pomphorhynchus laevis]